MKLGAFEGRKSKILAGACRDLEDILFNVFVYLFWYGERERERMGMGGGV